MSRTYDPPRGESIHQAAANALSLAVEGSVSFELDGTPGQAWPGETPGAVALRWYDRRQRDAATRRVHGVRPQQSARPAARSDASR